MDYRTLKSGELRVLRLDKHLQPFDNWGHIPSITVEIVTLDDDLDYHAISYVWGDANKTLPVLINGNPVMVTANLQKALRDIISNLKPSYYDHSDDDVILEDCPIWADAICINQSDDIEKSQQVARMGEIYAKASRVLIFLNPATTPLASSQAFSMLQTLAALQRGEDYLEFLKEVVYEARSYTKTKCEQYQTLLQPLFNYTTPEIQALTTLRDGTWWNRAWVLQEIALANRSRALVISGPLRLGWNTLIQAVKWSTHERITMGRESRKLLLGGTTPAARKTYDTIDKITSDLAGSIRVLTDTDWRTLGRQGSLADLLNSLRAMDSRPRQATLPHDTVYALLSLANDSDENGVVSDYSKPRREVCSDVSAYVLLSKGPWALQLMMLDESEGVEDTSKTCSSSILSSWIIDWANVRGWTPFQFWPTSSTAEGLEEQRSIFNASLHRTRYWWYEIHPDGTLHLRAYRVGSINRVAGLSAFHKPFEGDQARYNDSEEKQSSNSLSQIVVRLHRARRWLGWFNSFLDFCGEAGTLNAKDRADAWRVPIADMDKSREGNRVHPGLRKGFEFLCHTTTTEEGEGGNGDDLSQATDEAVDYALCLDLTIGGGMARTKDRQTFTTTTAANGGYCLLGLGSGDVKIGDQVFVIAGADIPLVLRNAGNGRFWIIEQAYIHRIMDGEFVAAGAESEEIVIV